MVAGQVRLADGRPVDGAEVMLFDLADLRRGIVARAATDAAGYFALPLASLGGEALPQGFMLGQNYPNPFNPSTMIPYQLPTDMQVRLEVFNVLGQHIATLVDEERPAGFHAAQWDATDGTGQAVAAGVYFYRLRGEGVELTQRMVLIDGQAGTAAAASSAATMTPIVTAEREYGEYGLVVSGTGLATYVDAAFGVRVGMEPVELVVEAAELLPRGKALTCGILGDVNNDGQVDANDALIVLMYSLDSSIALPNGNMNWGDVNADRQVNLADALAIVGYVANPLDESLPAGIGRVAASGSWVAGPMRRLTNNSALDQTPVWSPDGQKIAFASERDGNQEIYVMDANGANTRRLTFNSTDDYSPAWSPDGRKIAFSSERDGNVEIYVMDTDGANPRRLTSNSENDYRPAWSPDGQEIAFMSYRDGNQEIYVMDTDGANPRRLTYNSEKRRVILLGPLTDEKSLSRLSVMVMEIFM